MRNSGNSEMDLHHLGCIKPCIIVAFIYHPQLVFSPGCFEPSTPYVNLHKSCVWPVTFDVTTSSRRCCGRGWKAKIVWKKNVALDFGWRHPVSESTCSSSKSEQMLLIHEVCVQVFAGIEWEYVVCALFGCVKDGMMCFQPWLKECVRMHYLWFIHTVFAHMFHSFRIYELFVCTYMQLYDMNWAHWQLCSPCCALYASRY